MKSKNTIDLTLYEWVKNSPVNHCHIDQVNWPDNKPCSGVNNIQYQWLHCIIGWIFYNLEDNLSIVILFEVRFYTNLINNLWR